MATARASSNVMPSGAILGKEKLHGAAIVHPSRVAGAGFIALGGFEQKVFRQLVVIEYGKGRLGASAADGSFEDEFFEVDWPPICRPL